MKMTVLMTVGLDFLVGVGAVYVLCIMVQFANRHMD